MTADLSPAMLTVLEQLVDGIPVDGRSWRALQGLERRGYAEASAGEWAATDAGLEALAATRRPAAFHLELRLGNAAMLESCDVAAELRLLAGHVSADQEFEARDRAILDQNGNTIGSWGWGDATR